MKLTERELTTLKALGRFKFLTSSQLRLIFGCSLSSVNSALRSLKGFRYPLVKSIDF
ncbi:MAG: hypothetical protein HOL17_14440 [Gammaproteobacteria bacterium]|jgi:hypothetical protein|nr:hypothetical protein [Gammaproteobacteria bacterium]MBT3844586.1 hypothetical protein [Gammaproteobacteria bacterium]MBT4547926.1 hypothetical protein [Gammaproteobacteria bacterium]MBT5372901.1 hypothetical protein [Gammaproteobacteria bacterium]MBT6477702.1 hypothetical protein [Gammaproteobacteria bacterium]